MQTFQAHGISVPSYARGDVKVFCPRCHADRTRHPHDRSLSVNVDEGVWLCHHCGWSGSLRERSVPSAGAAYTRPEPIPTGISGEAVAFLERRRLPLSVVDQYGLTGNNESISVPYYIDGFLTNVKTRYFKGDDDKAGHSLVSGAELSLWNIDACRDAPVIAITEGEWDAMAICLAGIPAVSVPNGGSKGALKLDYLASALDVLEQAERILICVDTDETGEALERELVRRVGIEKCQRVTWSYGKDANDVLQNIGIDQLRTDLSRAREYPIEGLLRPSDIMREFEQLYRDGLSRGVSTGFDCLDPLYTMVDGGVTLITGITGAGKTEFLDQLMVNTILLHDWKWTIFSPESDPLQEHLARVVEKVNFAPFYDGPTQRMTWEAAKEAADNLDRYISFIDPEEPTLDEIFRLARREVLMRGVNAVVLDPWNEIIHDQRPGENISDYLSRRLRDVRRWAGRTGSHVFIVNHPHSMTIDPKTNQYPVVRHFDLNGGAMWANKVSGILSIWRDRVERDADVEINVIKTKTRRVGVTGKAMLRYDGVTGRVASAGPHAYELLG